MTRLRSIGALGWIPSLLIGLFAGVGSGLLGVGGGIVMVPLLTLVAGFTQHRAHATSLAAIIPIASVGSLAYVLAGEIDYGIAGLLIAGSLVGAPLGARIMSRVTENHLESMFGLLMLAVAIRLMLP